MHPVHHSQGCKCETRNANMESCHFPSPHSLPRFTPFSTLFLFSLCQRGYPPQIQLRNYGSAVGSSQLGPVDEQCLWCMHASRDSATEEVFRQSTIAQVVYSSAMADRPRTNGRVGLYCDVLVD